jgi:hypothetical protein
MASNSNEKTQQPKFIGNPTGSKTLAGGVANSKKIVEQAKQK